MDSEYFAQIGAQSEISSPPVFERAVKESVVLRSNCLIPIPLIRQALNYTCGVACVQAILRYIGYDFDTREDVLAYILRATPEEGTPVDAIVNFLSQVRFEDECRYKITATLATNWNIDGLKKELCACNPVICAIQAWHVNENGQYQLRHDYAKEKDNGHYVVAVGYDEKRIFS